MMRSNFLLWNTAAGETLEISEDTADADGTGTLSYSWQTSLMIPPGRGCWNRYVPMKLGVILKVNTQSSTFL